MRHIPLEALIGKGRSLLVPLQSLLTHMVPVMVTCYGVAPPTRRISFTFASSPPPFSSIRSAALSTPGPISGLLVS
jgi:hypothetical protein